MSSFHSRFGRDLKSRYARGAMGFACELEVLETRALDVGDQRACGGGGGGAHSEVHANAHAAPTPIGNFTGNPLTFSEIVGLPAVQNSLLPAVQDIATITSSTVPPKLNGYTVSIDWGDGTAATRGLLVKGKGG